MLDQRSLSELLTKNVHEELYPRIFVMSLSGKLISYSTPVDITKIRAGAALVSMAWRDHSRADVSSTSTAAGTVSTRQSQSSLTNSTSKLSNSASRLPQYLRALIIETETSNIVARFVEPNMLLVLIGGISDAKPRPFKITAEKAIDSTLYPNIQDSSSLDSDKVHQQFKTLDDGSRKDTDDAAAASVSNLTALHFQRQKAETLSLYIASELDSIDVAET